MGRVREGPMSIKTILIALLIIAGIILLTRYVINASTKSGAEEAKQKSFKDIDDAVEATKNIVCVATMVSAVSPHDGKLYQVGSPCVRQWLAENRNWKTDGIVY